MYNIIVVINNRIFKNIITSNLETAKRIFFGMCDSYISNWDEYTEEDKAACIAIGYERFSGGIVHISVPITTYYYY